MVEMRASGLVQLRGFPFVAFQGWYEGQGDLICEGGVCSRLSRGRGRGVERGSPWMAQLCVTIGPERWRMQGLEGRNVLF